MPATTVCPAPSMGVRGSTSAINAKVVDLVTRAQRGDSEAFGQFYNRYVDDVHRFILFRVGMDRPLAEDLTSDVFLRALRAIGSFTWQGADPGAWLVTIAKRLIADHYRSAIVRLATTVPEFDLGTDTSPEGNPEGLVTDHLRNVAVLTAVKQLSPDQQWCIALRFLGGLNVAETAEAMGKKESAVKALQFRAIRALAQVLPLSAVIA